MKNIKDFIEKIEEIAVIQDVGLCVSLLDDKGEQIFFIKIGPAIPLSTEFSQLKAKTSYLFQADNHDVYASIKDLGQVALFDQNYCFIDGGKVVANPSGKKQYLGVSSTAPLKDKEIAEQLGQFLVRKV
ncbi:heme-binding protein [Acinetobacter sp. ANC 3882]|uniref:heme-binding protein n=1 Tax=Acinetobacter sp. ANC 3882 TaxID=2923423 RepID=UPI001F4AFAE4|nr:heme-binding protein [Acinetobacter sp. ANC 3882]MCH7313790.1 heme-binding protein [Acinetobacter sp. ANC 3882]